MASRRGDRRRGGWPTGLFLVGFALLIAGPVAEAAGALGPQVELPAWRVGPGVVLAVAAIGLAIWAQEAMGAAWVADIVPRADVKVATEGPFRRVRNPTYCAMVTVGVASVLLAPNALATAGLAVLCVSVALTARAEEPLLRERLGEPYRQYAARTGRFIPGIGRLRGE